MSTHKIKEFLKMKKKITPYTPRTPAEVQIHARLKGDNAAEYKALQEKTGNKESASNIKYLLRFFWDNQPKI